MRYRRILILTICIALMLNIGPFAAHAEQEKNKVVRVGWYDSAYHRRDQFGRKSGYGYEYQQRVAIFTGWTYEYVEGSWSELLEKLIAGEIDLLSDVSYTAERAEKILYSAEAMGSEDYHAFIAPDNTEISPDDFSTFNGKKVGVNKNSIQEKYFVEWAENHGVHPEIVELSVKTPEMLEMLARGEIDVLVTLDTYGRSANVTPVCKVGYAESFFGINKNRPDLKQDLDVAMNRILEENRYFNEQMSERYAAGNAINSFLTMEEVSWLADHGAIRVGYRDNFLPFCSCNQETKTLEGALKEYLYFAKTAEKNAELTFETKAFATTEEALQALVDGQIDCVFPVSLSAYDGEQRGVVITDSLITTEMFAGVRTADQRGISRDQERTAAVIRGNPNYDTFLMDYFPEWRAQYYDNSEEAFQAVGSGNADCVLVSNYRLSRLSELCSKYRISTLSTGEAINQSFAVRREDDRLYSILNKINHLIPSSTLNTSLTSYAFTNEQVTLGKVLRDNLGFVVATAAVIVSIILLLVLRNMRMTAKANEGSQIISEAERDKMTQLYNRNFFIVYANRLYREHPRKPMDAIVMNIERFHSLNALNGRDFGDEVIRTLAGEIQAFIGENEGIAGRLEGDHFDIYCKHQDAYQPVLDRFQEKMNAIARKVDVRLCMGVMPWQEGMIPEQMFERAWSACRMVRGNYKTHLMVYDKEFRERDEMNRQLQNDLNRALEEHALQVYYQPKYNIQGERPRLSSAEALVRWKHPELGMISPENFIPLFERSGQISALDHYVWQEAAGQIAAWREKYGVTLPVSVNLSRVDVFEPSLPGTLDGLVGKYGLKRGDLMLEVTESAYTENADHLIQMIAQLREKGYEIEMDDFGSGYSSLNMLSSMPIDVLKMDIAFIRNMERNEKDFRMVELILDIARYLKVRVVAEGVETKNQLKLLKDAGCDIVQGYYFSKPLPVDEFEEKILSKAIKNGDLAENRKGSNG